MGDQKLSVAVAPDADHAAVAAALRQAEDDVLRGLARVSSDYSSYAQTGYEALKRLIPSLTDDRWREVTGEPVPGECRNVPYSCCGYCIECDVHHDVDETPQVCDMGRCHDCDHTCSH